MYLICDMTRRPEDFHWDLRTYYLAGEAFVHGENPYDQTVLNRHAHGAVPLKFVYPPLTLPLFRLLTLFDYPTVDRLWLVLQLIALAALAFLWRKAFLGKNADLLFWIFCVLAYNSPLYVGMKSGNIVFLEMLLIWGSFAMYIRERFVLFSVLLFAASIFKLTPILFAIALLYTESPRRTRYLVVVLSAFVAVQVLSFLVAPMMYREFLSNAGAMEEWGLANPSLYPLTVELFRVFFSERATMIPAVIPLIVYFALAAAVLVMALALLNRVRDSRLPDRLLVVTFLLMLVYILVLPRAKNYSYTLLLPGTYWIMKQDLSVSAFWAVFALSAFTIFTLPILADAALILWTYVPLLTACAVFALYESWAKREGVGATVVMGRNLSDG